MSLDVNSGIAIVALAVFFMVMMMAILAARAGSVDDCKPDSDIEKLLGPQ